MSSHFAYSLLTGLAFLDFLAALVIGRGLLERRRDARCQILAKDLTAKVRDRCDAYRRLEERIAAAIDDFDRHEAFPGREAANPPSPGGVTQLEPAPATPDLAELAEDLSWMDEVQDGAPPAALPTEGTRIEA